MSQIDKKQGSIKVSEVSIPSAQEVVNTNIREDALTFTIRLSKVLEDCFRRHQCFMSSFGELTWNDPNLAVPSTSLMEFLVLINSEDGLSRSVRCQFQPISLTSWNLSAHTFVYLELSRSQIESNSVVTLTDGINAAGTAGRRIVASNTLSRISDPNDGSPEGTLAIPILYKSGSGMWWIPNGMYWPDGTVSELGNTTKIVNVPLGTIVGIHLEGITDISGINQAYVDANFPGWWLCDGSLIVSPNPLMNGQYSPNLNSPIAVAPRNQGRFIRGSKKSGSTGGQDQVALLISQMPKHKHTLTTEEHQEHEHLVVNNSGSQVFLNTDGASGSGSVYVDSDVNTIQLDFWTSYAKHSHTLSAGAAATAHENIPQSVSLVYIVKVV